MGIAQPIHSTEKIWKRALELQHHFPKSEIITVDQTPVFDLLKPLVDQSVGVKGNLLNSHSPIAHSYFHQEAISPVDN